MVTISTPEGWDDIDGRRYYDYSTPTSDLFYALTERGASTYDVDGDAVEAEPVTLEQVETIELAHARYGGVEWEPGRDTETDLSLYALGQLRDGRWFTVDAWNDYTGWGCMYGLDVRIAATRERAISHGMTNEQRDALGLS